MSRVNGGLAFIEPQLATLVDHPPQGQEWIHEVKHDGYRTQLIIERGEARAYTRNGFDWSERYRSIIRAAPKLRCRSAILDGEAIVQDADGISDFERLSAAIRWEPERLLFYAFDAIYLDGTDLRDSTLLKRRAKLRDLLPPDETRPLQFSEEFTGDAAAFFRTCAKRRLEGVVSKLASSKYRSGRSTTWLKTKCFTESTLVIIGTDRDRKTGAPKALLARADERGLSYAGAAFIALAGSERQDLHARLQRMQVERCAIPKLRLPNARWVEPKLVVRVRYLAGARYLRHATVRSFN
jgi:bifunctional non-homologous end joining protein LigD